MAISINNILMTAVNYQNFVTMPINPKQFFASTNFCIILSEMAKKNLILAKTGIFYEFSKWREIEIRKPITESKNLPKGNG